MKVSGLKFLCVYHSSLKGSEARKYQEIEAVAKNMVKNTKKALTNQTP